MSDKLLNDAVKRYIKPAYSQADLFQTLNPTEINLIHKGIEEIKKIDSEIPIGQLLQSNGVNIEKIETAVKNYTKEGTLSPDDITKTREIIGKNDFMSESLNPTPETPKPDAIDSEMLARNYHEATGSEKEQIRIIAQNNNIAL